MPDQSDFQVKRARVGKCAAYRAALRRWLNLWAAVCGAYAAYMNAREAPALSGPDAYPAAVPRAALHRASHPALVTEPSTEPSSAKPNLINSAHCVSITAIEHGAHFPVSLNIWAGPARPVVYKGKHEV